MEIDEKKLKKIQKLLNETITDLLYGGSSDPGFDNLAGAAACFKTLKLLNLSIKNKAKIDEEDIKESLEKDNIYNRNFLV